MQLSRSVALKSTKQLTESTRGENGMFTRVRKDEPNQKILKPFASNLFTKPVMGELTEKPEDFDQKVQNKM